MNVPQVANEFKLFIFLSFQGDVSTPFSVMFNGRDPVTSDVPEEIALTQNMTHVKNDVTHLKSNSRRLLKKSLLTCRHCDEVFTSR